MQDLSSLDAKSDELTETEVKFRLASDGPNELPRQRHRSVFRIAIDVLREPMFMFLFGARAVYLALGERSEARTSQEWPRHSSVWMTTSAPSQQRSVWAGGSSTLAISTVMTFSIQVVLVSDFFWFLRASS